PTFPHLALLSWYAGGLRAVDLTDPASPTEGGAFVPTADFTPTLRDARLFFPAKCSTGVINTARPLPTDTQVGCSSAPQWTGAMWSYPVVQNGLIYVVDIDLGLYILQYTGPHHDEVDQTAFAEGNSSPSRYTASAPAPVISPAMWSRVRREVAHGTKIVRSPY